MQGTEDGESASLSGGPWQGIQTPVEALPNSCNMSEQQYWTQRIIKKKKKKAGKEKNRGRYDQNI